VSKEITMAVIRDVMPAFELFQPSSIGDAVALLDRHGADAWIMAGGMDSFDWLKDRIKRPSVVVDLSQVQELRGIRTLTGGGLEIGAGTTLTEIVRDTTVRDKFRLLSVAASSWPRRKSATRGPWAATCRRTRAAGTTARAGAATARAATSAMPTRHRPSIANTPFWEPIAAWP
jgi:xanthine dehydrogenase YagS FAD-binding subunit